MYRLLLAMTVAVAAWGQTSGAIQGSVRDTAGKPLGDVIVEIRSATTGASWKQTTNAEGYFLEPILAPGNYSARAVGPQAEQVWEQSVVNVGVGQRVMLNIQFQASTMTVESSAPPQLDLSSGAIQVVVDKDQMRDLPLNGRSFEQLALLQPGVTAAYSAGSSFYGARTRAISVNGARPEQNQFLLDGGNIQNAFNKTPGSSAGVLLGVDAVLEYQVLANAYSPEFGRAAGGVINAATRSGSNGHHGTLFYFHRNSALDAKNYFNAPSDKIPGFKRNQFGGAYGGALRKDKTFYFASYENLIERLGVIGVTAVPDANARQGILPSGPVAVNPVMVPYINALFPAPNGRTLSGGAAEYRNSVSQPTDEQLVQGRVDHRRSDTEQMFFRYSYSTGSVDRVLAGALPIARLPEATDSHFMVAEHVKALTPTLYHTGRLAFTRTTADTRNQRTVAGIDQLAFVPNSPFGFVTISGLTTSAGGDARVPRTDFLNNYQFGSSLLWIKGRHTVKTGFSGQRQQFNTRNLLQAGGAVTFANLGDFLQGRARSIDFSVPGAYDAVRGFRQTLLGGFFGDEWRVRDNFTVNYGMRYEFVTVPTEVNGKIANLREITDRSITTGGSYFNNPSTKNFAPRVGLAWQPRFLKQTVVRAGFGVFHDLLLPRYYFIAASRNPPFSNRVLVNNPQFPFPASALATIGNIPVSVNSFDPNPANPYMMQFNLAVEHQVRGWRISTAYVGSRGVSLPRQAEANLAPATLVGGVKTYQPQLGRLNPAFAGIVRVQMDARSFYNALQIMATRQLSHGLRMQAAYTWSKSIDDASGIVSSDFLSSTQYTLDYADRRLDRGLSSFHAGQVLTLNGSWLMPFGATGSRFKKAAIGGWQLHNVTTVQTGHPFSLLMGFNRSGNLNTASLTTHDRPDVNPSFTGNPITGDPQRWWNPDAIRMPAANQRGNLGRNTFTGPGLLMIDMALVKQLRLTESANVQLRSELFNITNTPNFATPAGRTAYTNAAGALASNQGVITSTVTSSRQMQVSLRVSF